MKDVQHHALAGFGLLGQGPGPLDDPGVQLLGQLLGTVKLQSKAAADVSHAAQRERDIEHPGAPQQIERVALYIKGENGQQGPHPEPGCDGAGKEQQPGGFVPAQVG